MLCFFLFFFFFPEMVGYKIWITSEQQELSVYVCAIYDFFSSESSIPMSVVKLLTKHTACSCLDVA